MGMYTELVIVARIKDDPVVVNVIKHMLKEETKGDLVIPNHPLFRSDRWEFMLRCDSYYFVPRGVSLFEYDDIGKYWVLINRSDFKNYDDEVSKFINWITPYVHGDEMFAYSRYEEAREPTIYYGKEI